MILEILLLLESAALGSLAWAYHVRSKQPRCPYPESCSESVRLDIAAIQQAKAFQSAFEDAAHGMAIVGPTGAWLRVNRALARLLGYTVSELVGGMTFQDVTHPDDLAKDEDLFDKLRRGAIPWYHLPKRYVRRDGSVIHILLTASVVRYQDGRIDFYVAQITERTTDHLEIERLRAERNRWRSVAEMWEDRAEAARKRHIADLDKLVGNPVEPEIKE
jgi:PAS domain S-box-containing protein